jgi:hypothetical protein
MKSATHSQPLTAAQAVLEQGRPAGVTKAMSPAIARVQVCVHVHICVCNYV